MNVYKYRLIVMFLFFFIDNALSLPNGWRETVKITNLPNDEHRYSESSITADNEGGIHVVVRKDEEDPRCRDVDYYRSQDAGLSWSKIYTGANFGTPGIAYRATDITIKGDSVMFAYQYPPGIYFIKSTDNGDSASWLEEECISSSTLAKHPRIVVDGSHLHTVFSDKPQQEDYEIFHSVSTNGGLNWTTAQRITNAVNVSWHPAISVGDGGLHSAWADNRRSSSFYDIYYNRSTDHGSSWVYGSTGTPLNEYNSVSEYPDIATYTINEDTCVFVVWQDDIFDSAGIWFRYSTNNGSTWQIAELLIADGHHPSIAVDSRGLYVVCEKNSNICYLESTDWGSNWQGAVRITSVSDADSFPQIIADDMGRHITYVKKVSNERKKIWYIQRDIVNPATPTGLSANPFQCPPPVILTWYANSDADFKEYKVYRAILGGPFFTNIGTTTDTTYTDNMFPVFDTSYVYYVRAIDIANNYSDPSDTVIVYVPPPNDRMNVGQSTASSFTLLRDGYHAWGMSPDSSADYGKTLKYQFTKLDPEYEYTFGFGLFEPASDSGRVIALKSGSYIYQDKVAIPESTVYACYVIPQSLYSQGTLEFTIPGIVYEAVVSEILIWEREKSSGGPQSSQTAEIQTLSLDVYPTLTSSQVTIHYTLPSHAEGMMEIYDCAGKLVHSIENLHEHGAAQATWDGKAVPAGVYFIRLKTSDLDAIQKVIMVK